MHFKDLSRESVNAKRAIVLMSSPLSRLLPVANDPALLPIGNRISTEGSLFFPGESLTEICTKIKEAPVIWRKSSLDGMFIEPCSW